MADSTLMDVMKIVIPTVVTGIGGYFAWRKWIVERRSTESSMYQKERREAYQKLWSSLEEAHAIFKLDTFDSAEITPRLDKVEQNIKVYFLDQGIYVDDDDRDLVLLYLRNLRIMKLSGRMPGDVPGWDPKTHPRGEIPHAQAVIQTAVALNRKKLIAKIRHVLGAQE